MKTYFLLTSILLSVCIQITSAQWESCNNGLNGIALTDVRDIVISGDNIYASDYDNLYLSTNNGDSWASISDSLKDNYSIFFAVDGNTIYASFNYDYHIYQTTNNGKSWDIILTTYSNIYSIAASSGFIIAGLEDNGVIFSDDKGKNWQGSNLGLSNERIYKFIINGNNIIAKYYYGIMLSDDKGFSWHSINPKSGYSVIDALASNGNIIYTAINKKAYKSTDNGTTWVELDSNISKMNISAFTISYNKVYAGTYNGFFLSTDSGNSWNRIDSSMEIQGVETIAVKDSSFFAGAYDEPIYCSTDYGKNWHIANRGNYNNILTLYYHGNALYAGIYGGLFISKDNGSNWQSISNELFNDSVTAIAVQGINIFAGTYGYGIYRSTDNGTSWSSCNNGLTLMNVDKILINDNNIFAETPGGIFLSSNNGDSWNSINHGLNNFTFRAFAQIGNSIFLGNSDGLYIYNESSNLWQKSSTINFVVYNIIGSENNGFAFTREGFYMSSDGGANWFIKNSGFKTSNYDATISGSSLYVSLNYVGLLFSADSGFTWYDVSYNLKNYSLTAITANKDYIFAAKNDKGLYRAKISDLTTLLDVNEITDDTEISLFPNPGTDYININLSNSNFSKSEITIFNELGNSVYYKEIKEGSIENNIYVNTENFESGVYFFKIRNGSSVETRKFVIIK